MTFYHFFSIHLPAFVFTMAIIGICVLFHFKVLVYFSSLLEQVRSLKRMRMMVLIFGILAAHLIEIWMFAFGYMILQFFHIGSLLEGDLRLGFLDIAYFSAATFTTVGYGDILPNGPARFMSGMEALTGLVLVAWSCLASDGNGI